MIPYNIVTKVLVQAYAWIDISIYTLFSWIMSGYFTLANATNTIFGGEEFLADFVNRFYALIGIFALFKLAFNLLSSIINPEKFNDKEQGFGKIIQRTIIALIMVVMLPTIFNLAFNMQNDILETIPKVILGRSNGAGLTENEQINYGEAIAATTLKAFINPNETHCNDESSSAWSTSNPDLTAIAEVVGEKCNSAPGKFKYNYMIIVSTISGIVLIVLMFIMSLDVATRTFKLLVLEIIAPLPIISYIDPKSAKGGMFDSWLKLTTKTYLSIFFQMASVYFVLAVLTMAIGNINGGSISFPLSIYVTLFLIIGAFLFMFQASKFINQALGIKNDEKGAASKILGLGAAGAGAAALGAAGGLLAGGGLAGAGAAALEGFNSGIHGGKVTAGFGKGLDIGTRIKSGGTDTKYKNFLMKGQQNLMQKQAAKELFGDPNADMDAILKKYKDIRNADSAAYDAAKAQYERGESFEYNGQTYSGDELYQLIYNKDGLRMKAQTSEGKFNDVKNYMASFGVRTAKMKSIDEARDANKYFATDHSNMPEITRSVQNSTPSPSGNTPINTNNIRYETLQESIDRVNNVHNAPTREEHNH